MHKLIFDCDNTMGVEGKDIDDGLALLYMLGRNDVDILGITTTFGNSTIDIVYDNTKRILKDLNINNIPVYKGAASKNNRKSEAAKFLVNMAKKYKGEINLLATGSLTNLLGAYEIDNKFFSYLKQVVLMGGITKPLIINGKHLDELNFSCDPMASLKVLSSEAYVTVLTGHICLQAFFGEDQFNRMLKNDSYEIYKYISKSALNWCKFIMNEFGINGFYNWDIVAAVYITNPDLFNKNPLNIVSNEIDLKIGYLKESESPSIGYRVNIPTLIKDIERFNKIIFEAWEDILICSFKD